MSQFTKFQSHMIHTIENVAFFISQLWLLNCDVEIEQFQLSNFGFKNPKKNTKLHFLMSQWIRYYLFKVHDSILNV